MVAMLFGTDLKNGTADEASTLIFYAPPHGLVSILRDAAEVLGGNRACVIARELTKVICAE